MSLSGVRKLTVQSAMLCLSRVNLAVPMLESVRRRQRDFIKLIEKQKRKPILYRL